MRFYTLLPKVNVTLYVFFIMPIIVFLTGAPDSQAASGSNAALTSKQFCQQIESLLCLLGAKDCQGGTNSDHQAKDLVPEKQQQCLEAINAASEQKKLRFNAQYAAECVKVLGNLASQKNLKPPVIVFFPGCMQVVLGLQSQGMSCDSTLSCSSPLVCIKAPGQGLGQCQVALKKGAICDDSPPNGSLFYWYVTQYRPLCIQGLRCQNMAAESMRCQ